MTIDIHPAGSQLQVSIAGRLDTLTSPEFDSRIAPYIKAETALDTTIDCSGLEYVSSAGLRSFITVLKSLKAAGRELTLTSLPQPIAVIFEMTGFSSIFKIL